MVFPDKVDFDRQTTDSDRLSTRSIRSFVVRNGRVTSAQSQAIKRLIPRYGLEYREHPADLAAAFNRKAPVWLEIGFGNGDALLDMATNNPGINFLGAEVHNPGVGHALLGMEARQLDNIRLVQHDAMEVLENMLAPGSLAKVLLLFPDPWHKKRHHKRRIVQIDFLDAVARALVPDGILHCATDWTEYADWILARLEADPRFENQAGTGQFSARPCWRPVTRFERRGTRLGHRVNDLLFTRTRT